MKKVTVELTIDQFELPNTIDDVLTAQVAGDNIHEHIETSFELLWDSIAKVLEEIEPFDEEKIEAKKEQLSFDIECIVDDFEDALKETIASFLPELSLDYAFELLEEIEEQARTQ